MKQLLLYALLLTAFLSNGQTVFFTSQQAFPNKASKFYSSLAQNDSLLLFNAKDYKLYAYEKATGRQLWVYNLGWQSNVSPFFAGTSIWANTKDGASVQLDLKGREVKTLPFSIETQPVLKSNILYTTGIYDGGCLIAYNLAADSVVWKRFLAHGCSRQPYYFGDKIFANAEGNHWLEITYDGRLKNSACETEEHTYPSELSCAESFAALTHDGKKINGRLAEDLATDNINGPEMLTIKSNSFVLTEGRLTVLGNKLRKQQSITLTDLSDSIEEDSDAFAKILKADDANVWVLYSNKLLVIQYKKQKLLQTIDLQKWMPHQAVLDGNRLWLISKNDGLLYGLTL